MEEEKDVISIISWNVRSDSFAKQFSIENMDADIVCLQEVWGGFSEPIDTTKYPYYRQKQRSPDTNNRNGSQNLITKRMNGTELPKKYSSLLNVINADARNVRQKKNT